MSVAAKNIQAKRWTLEYPELGTGPVPIEPYVSKEYFEREREKLFKRTWFCLGRRAEEIPRPGDYLVHEKAALEAASSSLRTTVSVRNLDASGLRIAISLIAFLPLPTPQNRGVRSTLQPSVAFGYFPDHQEFFDGDSNE